MGATNKPAPTPVDTPTPEVTQAFLLTEHARSVLAEAAPELRAFKSKNTGLYVTKSLKASDARAKGITVPPGGKVKVQVTVIVVDPENSDN